MDYLQQISMQLGVALAWLVVLIIWSAIWKLIALWKSARKGSIIWFIVLALINTAGILEILYIFIFSEMGKPKPVIRAKRKK